MSANRPSGAVRRGSVLTLVLGIVLVAVYSVLEAFGVVGQPTDIGGGVVLLAGYVATALGVVLVGADLLRVRSRRQ